MTTMTALPLHLSATELQVGLDELIESPGDHGTLEMIVCRPAIGERLVLERGELSLADGLVGDNWRARGSKSTPDGSANPAAQLTLTNSRVMQLLARELERWPLAGDQLYVDLDLSMDNLPPGQRIAIGTAVVEISELPHTGCAKFTERFGGEAIRFVNSQDGLRRRRRGLNAWVVQPGVIAVGDEVVKVVRRTAGQSG